MEENKTLASDAAKRIAAKRIAENGGAAGYSSVDDMPMVNASEPVASDPLTRESVTERYNSLTKKIDSLYAAGEANDWEKERSETMANRSFDPERDAWSVGNLITGPKHKRGFNVAKYILDKAGSNINALTETGAEQEEASSFKSIIQQLTDRPTSEYLSMGYIEPVMLKKLRSVVEKSSKGEKLTQAEELILEAYAISKDVDGVVQGEGGLSSSASIGSSMSVAPDYVLQMALTSPAAGIGSQAAIKAGAAIAQKFGMKTGQKVMQEAAEEVGKKAVYSSVKQWAGNAGKTAVKAAKQLPTAALATELQNPLMSGSYTNYENRTLDQYGVSTGADGNVSVKMEDPTSEAERRYKAHASSFAETFTERLGGILQPLRILNLPTNAKLGAMMSSASNWAGAGLKKLPSVQPVVGALSNFISLNSTTYEVGEEFANTIIEPLITGEPERLKDNLTKDNLLQTAYSTMAVCGALNITTRSYGVAHDLLTSRKYSKAASKCLSGIENSEFRTDMFNAMAKRSPEEQLKAIQSLDFASAIPTDKGLALDYMEAKINADLYRGVRQENLIKDKLEESRQFFSTFQNEHTGNIELAQDKDGVELAIMGDVDNLGSDGIIFVKNTNTGETVQMPLSELSSVVSMNANDYMVNALRQAEAQAEQSSEQQAKDDIMAEATTAGVNSNEAMATRTGVDLNKLEDRMVTLKDGTELQIKGVFRKNGSTQIIGTGIDEQGQETDVEIMASDIVAIDGEALQDATLADQKETPTPIERTTGVGEISQSGAANSDPQMQHPGITLGQINDDAIIIPKIELTEQSWNSVFGEDNTVSTPIGVVKMGDNQMKKLLLNNRAEQFNMVVETLKNPTVVINENRDQRQALVFIKSFINEKNNLRYYSNIVVDKDGTIVNISSHYLREGQVQDKIEKGELLYKTTRLSTSDQVLLEQTPQTDDAGVSDSKVTNLDSQMQAAERKIPLLKDGTPDYDAMSAQMFFQEYSKEASAEEAIEELLAELGATEEKIDKLSNKKTQSRNELIKNKREIKQLQEKAVEIAGVLKASQTQQDENLSHGREPSTVDPSITERYNTAEKVYGNSKTLIAPNGEPIKGRYVLLESGVVTPSHNAYNFAPTPGFPVSESGSTVNDRDYSKDKQAQQIVVEMATKYDGRAIESPVIVSPDGVVISGNNRTMSGEIAAQNGTDEAYVEHLTDNAEQFGFTAKQVQALVNPRVVFETTDPQSYTTETFAKFNAQETKTQNKVEKAVKIGKTISERAVTQLAKITDEFETLGELYSDTRAVNRVAKILLDNGVIGQTEVAEMLDGDSLSAIGKDVFETVLVGAVVGENSVRLINRDGMKKYRQRLVKAILPILQNKSLGEYSIIDNLDESIIILDKARRMGSPVAASVGQLDAFKPAPDGELAITLAKALEGSDRGIKQVFMDYNAPATIAAGGQKDMFTGEVKSKEAILEGLGFVEKQDSEQVFMSTAKSGEKDATAPLANDPVVMAQTPQQKFEVVSSIVSDLNKLSGIEVIVFRDASEVPNSIAEKFFNSGKTVLGLTTLKRGIYIHEPAISSLQELQAVYNHEVAGHYNVVRSIEGGAENWNELFCAIVDQIGISEMATIVTEGSFVEYVNDYFNNPTLENKIALGAEFIAYYAEINFDVMRYSEQGNGKIIVNLSDIGIETINNILTTVNNIGNGQTIIIDRTNASPFSDSQQARAAEYGEKGAEYGDPIDVSIRRGRGTHGGRPQHSGLASHDREGSGGGVSGVLQDRDPQGESDGGIQTGKKDSGAEVSGANRGSTSGVKQVTGTQGSYSDGQLRSQEVRNTGWRVGAGDRTGLYDEGWDTSAATGDLDGANALRQGLQRAGESGVGRGTSEVHLEDPQPRANDRAEQGNGERPQTHRGRDTEGFARRAIDESFSDGPELEQIKAKAIADGTFMLSPNGKSTNLTEQQWLEARTQAFKEQFGDWEKVYRIEKLRKSTPIEITGKEIGDTLDKSVLKPLAEKYGLGYCRGTFINEDTGNSVSVMREGIRETVRHGYELAHLQSIAAIPQMIKDAVYITSQPNDHPSKKSQSIAFFDYYALGLNIGGVDYTAKITIGVDLAGNKFYDHALTTIEKSDLISQLGISVPISKNQTAQSLNEGSLINLIRIPNLNQENDTTLSEIKDIRLISILQTNLSKVLDANFEPLAEDVRFMTVAQSTELEQIKAKAIADGTFMLSPNGKPTNLTEQQWLQARTKAFKEHFGDWEKVYRIEKLRNSSPIEITGKEITPNDDLKEYKRNALEYGKTLKGEYVNKDTGAVVALTGGSKLGGLRELFGHDFGYDYHIQSIAAIPQIIEQAIYVTTLDNENANKPQILSTDYYVCGIEIAGEPYTVKAVVANSKDGKKYYDHKLTQIEKGQLLTLLEGLSMQSAENSHPNTQKESPLSEIKDKRLLSILQTNSSKALDANFEPFADDVRFREVESRLGVNVPSSETQKREEVEALSKTFNTPVRVVRSAAELPAEIRRKVEKSKQAVAGLYLPRTGEVYIILDNNIDVAQVQATFLHEVVAHKGVAELVGRDNVDRFYGGLYDQLNAKARKELDSSLPRNIAVEEYFGTIAEGGVSPSVMRRVLAYIREFFRELGVNLDISDNDIRYMLWRSANNLRNAKSVSDLVSLSERETAIKNELGVENNAVAVLERPATASALASRLSAVGTQQFREEEVAREMHKIKQDAVANGTFMLSPNGEITNLNERQWLQVRTKAFRKWFGDWEKVYRIEKLRNSSPIEITGKEITPNDDLKEYKRNALEYGKTLKGEYVNQDTGAIVALTGGSKSGGLREILHHDYKDVEHLQSIAAIPQIIESSIFIAEELNEDVGRRPNVSSYKYYICGLKIDGVDYTVKAIVAVDVNGKSYYDHKLTQIEKGVLISGLPIIQKTGPNINTPNLGFTPKAASYDPNPSYTQYKDGRLLSILQTNSSKVLDANFEPMVVYHGTNADFSVFDIESSPSRAAYFTDAPALAEQFARDGGGVMAVFVDIKNPMVSDAMGRTYGPNDGVSFDLDTTAEQAQVAGHDGGMVLKIGDALDLFNNEPIVGAQYYLFDPSQVKSATSNTGAFDAAQGDIRFRKASTPTPISIIGGKNKLTWGKAAKKIVDDTTAVKRFEKLIKKMGGVVDIDSDIHSALYRRASASKAKMEEYRGKFIKPLLLHVSDIVSSYSFTQGQVERYMVAKHAIEREDVSKIKGFSKDEKANWTREEAESVVAEFEEAVPAEIVEKLWRLNRSATNEILKMLHKAGIMSTVDYNFHMARGWEHYVPLRGWNFENEGTFNPDEVFDFRDKYKAATGKEALKRAKGRTTEAVSPLANIWHIASTTIALCDNNEVRKHALKLVRDNKGVVDGFELLTKWYQKGADGNWSSMESGAPTREQIDANIKLLKQIKDATDELTKARARFVKATLRTAVNESEVEQINGELVAISEKIEALKSMQMFSRSRKTVVDPPYTKGQISEKTIDVYENGVVYSVIFPDPEIANAIRGPQRKDSTFFTAAGFGTRYMSNIYTSKNPEFIIANWVRDMQQAANTHLVDRGDGNFKGFMMYAGLDSTRNISTSGIKGSISGRAIQRHLRGRSNALTVAELGQYDVLDPDQRAHLSQLYGANRVYDTLYEIFLMGGGETGYVHIAAIEEMERKLARIINGSKVVKKIDQASDALNFLAIMSENSTRFATFLAIADTGRGEKEAINYAKNVTVNFNVKGEWARNLGLLYSFFNATIQGTATQVRLAMKEPLRYSASAAIHMAMGYIVPKMLSYLDWLDDDEEISKYDLMNNLCIPLTSGQYIKIPVQQGLRAFYGIGALAWMFEDGRVSTEDFATGSLAGIIDNTSPFATANDWSAKAVGRIFVPTVAVPLYDVATNTNFFGGKVHKESYGSRTIPDSQLYKKGVNGWLKSGTEWLNEAMGGNQYTPAGINADGSENGLKAAFDLNPSNIEHLLVGYTGGVGRFANNVFKLAYSILPNGEELETKNYPIVNRFMGDVRDRSYAGEFWEAKTRLDNLSSINRKNIKGATVPGNFNATTVEELVERQYDVARKRNLMRSAKRRLDGINGQIDGLRGDDPQVDVLEKEKQLLMKSTLQQINP